MYYHYVARFPGQTRKHRWWNRTKDNVITDILGPFLRGQKIEGTWVGRGGKRFSCLINMGTVDHFLVFKTRRRLSSSQLRKFKKNNSIGHHCTSELVREIRFDRATKQAKSLMERLMLPPKRQIFVIMKFDDPYLDSAYKGAIRPIGEEFGYNVLRIDHVEDSGMITAQIVESIAESEVVLADLTGARPNCYYETGVAYATGRELILCIKEGEEIHFDLSVNRFIVWKTEQDLREQLRQRLNAVEIKDS